MGSDIARGVGQVRQKLASGVQRAALDPVAAVALAELETLPAVDPPLLEAIAEHLHERAGSGELDALVHASGIADLDALVAAAGCRWAVERELPMDGLYIPTGQILVRARRDGARMRLVALHELAHAVLETAGIHHVHADVWRLTLALGAPRNAIRKLRRELGSDALALAASCGLPAWAAERRLRDTEG